MYTLCYHRGMKFVLKLVMLWMLAVAIPFQGFASAAMLACEQAPAQPVATHDAGTKHDHCADIRKSQSDDASSPSHACTPTCGATAAFTLPALTLAPLPARREPVRFIVQFVPDAVSPTPERPPRLS